MLKVANKIILNSLLWSHLHFMHSAANKLHSGLIGITCRSLNISNFLLQVSSFNRKKYFTFLCSGKSFLYSAAKE